MKIKKTASPSREDVQHFRVLERLGLPIGPGCVICLALRNDVGQLWENYLNTNTSLIERAHAASVLVVYIQHASDKVLPLGSADWQLHLRLHPDEGDLIVHKQHSNAFENTPLHTELTGRGIDRVIVTGLVTHGCVKATCLGALALGYTVTLAADGHSSYSKDATQLILEWNRKLSEVGAVVAPAAQIAFRCGA